MSWIFFSLTTIKRRIHLENWLMEFRNINLWVTFRKVSIRKRDKKNGNGRLKQLRAIISNISNCSSHPLRYKALHFESVGQISIEEDGYGRSFASFFSTLRKEMITWFKFPVSFCKHSRGWCIWSLFIWMRARWFIIFYWWWGK